MLRVTDISKSFDTAKEPALKDISFEVQAGETIALLGHNGAGKTTLIDILCGLQRADSGNVRLEIPMQAIGWCPQRQIIDWSLTAAQNIRLARDLSFPHNRSEINADVLTVLTMLGLQKYAHRTAETLSGGELRRVQIARALVNKPQLAILDEPTTGLDPDAIAVVFEYIEQSRLAGNSAIISTHETSRFAHYCTRVIALHAGKMVADLPRDEFMQVSEDKEDLWAAYKYYVPE